MKITVLFLGPARDLSGVDSEEIDLQDHSSIGDLRGHLSQHYPKLGAALGAIRFAVNETFATDATALNDGDEVALSPPVSGGTDEETVLVDLVSEPICIDRVRSFIMGDPAYGGIATFEGVTRSERDPDHGDLIRLEYEAYESMARQQLEVIAEEACRRWKAGRVAIIHRLASVPPGEVSVMISVACGHRAEAFESCRWLIDTLKKDVPIWKKDVFEDGLVRWVGPKQKDSAP